MFGLDVGVLKMNESGPFGFGNGVLGGIGYYDVALAGGDAAKAASPLFSSAQAGIPLGVGLDVPLTWPDHWFHLWAREFSVRGAC